MDAKIGNTSLIALSPNGFDHAKDTTAMPGPLHGYRIIELAGLGPAPFAGMMLADMGADVIRVIRPSNHKRDDGFDILQRGRRSIAVDLKNPDGVATADGLIEGFRPGVTERLGLGPDTVAERNPKLVYGRMTGWGQTGPYAKTVGHDINYISISGTLAHIGRAGEAPVPPLNLVGDFGGGGMLLAYGMVCGLLEAQRSGQGQVIDAAMIDGAASLMAMFWSMKHAGNFDENTRGTDMLDTGAHYYDVFECADGKYVSIGSIEPQFYAELLRLTGLTDDPEFIRQNDRALWPALKVRLAEVIRAKTQAEWIDIMEYSDVCFAPVLTMSEAAAHHHNIARSTFVERDGYLQPGAAPRFSRTPGSATARTLRAGQHTLEVLADVGLSNDEIAALLASGAVFE
jgi:alpha-methylacyl-CoA racemase